MTLDLTPTDLAEVAAARAEEAQAVAERVRDMLRRCRLLEDPFTETRAGLADDHYTFDVRYLVGAIQTLVDDRARTAENVLLRFEEMDRLASLEVAQLREQLNRADAKLALAQADLAQAEADSLELLDLLERARRG